MGTPFIISSDRQAREVANTLSRIDEALSSDQVFRSIADGLPPEVVEGIGEALQAHRGELAEALDAYRAAKHGKFDALVKMASGDPGALLIIARIANGLSQKDLARKLGLREQAIQRYEAERYRSINLSNFQKIAGVLGVRLVPEFLDDLSQNWGFTHDLDPSVMRKVLKHARDNGWLEREGATDEDAIGALIRSVGDHVVRHGTPSLLRTGLKASAVSEDWVLIAWKANVTRRAESIIAANRVRYDALDFSWLSELVKLSEHENGPTMAVDLLLSKGIILVIEPQIPGMALDGASFLVDDVPVIGMTLLRDTLDNFWFTLLHEIGHVVLHRRKGLLAGFFDDFQNHGIEVVEKEANSFAGNMLIPDELWRLSPARVSKSPEPMIKLAQQLNISPAIVFGRVRMERGNYTLFSDRIGRGAVRRQLLPK